MIAAGFPAINNKPVWQRSSGEITNERASISEMTNPKITTLIQHSAGIDPGSSGGPLLIEPPSSHKGVKVIGVNTWTISSRQSTNFSIPAAMVENVISKAAIARQISKSEPDYVKSLEENCKLLEAELGSEHKDDERIMRYISYAYVAKDGFKSFQTINDGFGAQEDKKTWNLRFIRDPIGTMQVALYLLFRYKIKETGNWTTIKYESINYADRSQIMTLNEVRTNFSMAGKNGQPQKLEFVWIYEHGHWKIGHHQLGFEPAPESAPSSSLPQRDTSPSKPTDENGIEYDGNSSSGLMVGYEMSIFQLSFQTLFLGNTESAIKTIVGNGMFLGFIYQMNRHWMSINVSGTWGGDNPDGVRVLGENKRRADLINVAAGYGYNIISPVSSLIHVSSGIHIGYEHCSIDDIFIKDVSEILSDSTSTTSINAFVFGPHLSFEIPFTKICNIIITYDLAIFLTGKMHGSTSFTTVKPITHQINFGLSLKK